MEGNNSLWPSFPDGSGIPGYPEQEAPAPPVCSPPTGGRGLSGGRWMGRCGAAPEDPGEDNDEASHSCWSETGSPGGGGSTAPLPAANGRLALSRRHKNQPEIPAERRRREFNPRQVEARDGVEIKLPDRYPGSGGEAGCSTPPPTTPPPFIQGRRGVALGNAQVQFARAIRFRASVNTLELSAAGGGCGT